MIRHIPLFEEFINEFLDEKTTQIKPGDSVKLFNDVDKDKKYKVLSIDGNNVTVEDGTGEKQKYDVNDLVFPGSIHPQAQ